MALFQIMMDLGISITPTLFIVNMLVATVCLIAAPRTWARRLCLTFAWLNTVFVLTMLASLIYVLIWYVLHRYREETRFVYDLIVYPFLPLVLGMVGLLAVYNRFFRAANKTVQSH